MFKPIAIVSLVATVLATGVARALDDFAADAMSPIEDDLPPPPDDSGLNSIDDDLTKELNAADPAPVPAPTPDKVLEPPLKTSGPAPTAPPSVTPPSLPASAPRRPDAVEESRGPIVREEERASSAAGEKIFDWSKHKGETEVAHPFAEKGLIRIDKQKIYYYKVEETESRRAADFHAGPFNPYNLSNPEDDGPYSYYGDNYNGGAPAIMVNYEWQLFNSAVGRTGLRAGGGLFFSQGHGHFVHLDNSVLRPLEVFSFAAFPINFGVVYRAQWFHRQLLVPYVEGGGTLWAFAETRDDGKRPKFGGSLAAYGALGVGFNLTYYNALSRISLDREYGIHAIYLIAEYRRSQALSPRFDFSADFINGGLLMEF